MTPENMQAIIDKAGLYHTEAAKLFDNVTRQTLSNWLKGIPPKNKSIFERAQKICSLLERATAQHLLPLPAGTPPKERMGKIVGVIKAMMKGKPAQD